MATRTAALVALIFAAGAGLGRYTQPSGPPPDLRGGVWVLSLDCANGPHGVNRHFAPIRVVVDGQCESVPEAPRDGEKWRLALAGGRVVLFLAAVDPPNE